MSPAAVSRGRNPLGGVLVFALVYLAGILPAVAAQSLPSSEDCLACHSDRTLTKKGPAGRSIALFVDQALLQGSVHGVLECVQCHADATEVPHPEALKKVRCQHCHGVAVSGAHVLERRTGLTCSTCHGSHAIGRVKEAEVAICKTCHRAIVKEYDQSVHGRALARGEREVAQCHTCHGSAHELKKVRDPGSPVYPLNLPRTCGTCHGDPELAKRHGIPVANVFQLYMDSIHGRAVTRSGLLVAATCSSCHGAHDIRRREDPASRVHRTKIPITCGGCHAGVLTVYRESIHGREVAAGNAMAPICIDCHTAHEIRRVETEAWKLEIVRECGTCHAESLRTYRDTFHGQVTALGFTRVARCSDCHGAHNILPVSDARSRVNPVNLVSTCQTCHPAANVNFVKYDPHADPENRTRNPLLYYAARFMTWLLVGVCAFFGVHTTLWGTRALVAKRRGTALPPEPEEPV